MMPSRILIRVWLAVAEAAMDHGLALQWRHFKQSLLANSVRLTCWRTSCYPRGNILSQSARA